jgi:hypothetical protein
VHQFGIIKKCLEKELRFIRHSYPATSFVLDVSTVALQKDDGLWGRSREGKVDIDVIV